MYGDLLSFLRQSSTQQLQTSPQGLLKHDALNCLLENMSKVGWRVTMELLQTMMEQSRRPASSPMTPDSECPAHTLSCPAIYPESQHLCIYLLILNHEVFILSDIVNTVFTLNCLIHQNLY